MTFSQCMHDGQTVFTVSVMGWVVIHYIGLLFGSSMFPVTAEFVIGFAAAAFVVRPLTLFAIEKGWI